MCLFGGRETAHTLISPLLPPTRIFVYDMSSDSAVQREHGGRDGDRARDAHGEREKVREEQGETEGKTGRGIRRERKSMREGGRARETERVRDGVRDTQGMMRVMEEERNRERVRETAFFS